MKRKPAARRLARQWLNCWREWSSGGGLLDGAGEGVGEGFGKYRGMRVGLIANPASVDRGFVHAVERFAASREIKLAAIFGPQHGFKSDQQDNMIESQDEVDPRLG